jgi:hypothetical protein
MNRFRRAAAPLALAALLVACVPPANLPEDCGDPAVTLQATLVDEELQPSTLEACSGQEVTIVLDVQRDAIFHLHGYDDEVPAREVTAGETVELSFTASRSGQFPIAIHTEDGPAEAEVGALIVHER